jgi:hypothetical protein
MGLLRRSKEDHGDLAARGRPAFDLTAWAQRRGLEFRAGAPQAGYLSVTCPWSVDVLFNVVRGHWPGGTYGVLCHEARIYAAEEGGAFYGEKAAGSDSGAAVDAAALALDVIGIPAFFGGGKGYFKVPYTSAGARAPHLSTITGMHVARRAERFTEQSSIWTHQEVGDADLSEQWVAAVRKHSDQATAERLIAGPVRELLAAEPGLGFELRVEWGQVVVSRYDFLERDEDLDALVATAEWFARAVGETCAPEGATARPLDEKVVSPEWLQFVADRLDEAHTLWPVGARLERVVQIAVDRRLAVEDSRAFHRSFPRLNVPGEAFGVLRGQLPGTALTGRLLCCAERPMVLPDEYRKFLTDPGGSVGCDVAVLAVDPAAPSTRPEGEVDGTLRFAVDGGVFTAWRTRPRWQADSEALDQLSADVAALVDRRALSPSPTG